MKRTHFLAAMLLLLLAATFLRLHNLADIPPGVTHDEADHGVDAWGVVNGIRPLYFTVGYGREPLYDYSTATLMTFLGPTNLAGRLTSVFFSLILIAGAGSWVRLAFDRRVALLTAAGLAVGFWPLMVSRHALRTITMPALFVLAACWFWLGVRPALRGQKPAWRPFVVAGLFLGATFYTYIPARLMWLIFPAWLIYLLWVNRPAFRRSWPGTLLMLGIAALLGVPLFLYLLGNPAAEVRLDQLAAPLAAVLEGNFVPLWTNIRSGLPVIAAQGDPQWRYNIAGRPFLTPPMALLFVGGLIVVIMQFIGPDAQEKAKKELRRPAGIVLAVLWLVVGLAPVLVTGPELSTTQAIGLMPVIYLFPALALVAGWDWLQDMAGRRVERWAWVVVFLLFGWLAVDTGRSYFVTWANQSEVRTHYETTLVSTMRYLNEHGQGPVAVSSLTPNRFHDPATAQMTLDNEAVDLRWFNGQSSLLVPQDGPGTLVFTGWSALHPALAAYWPETEPAATLPLRATDENRPVTFYPVDGSTWLSTIYPHFQATTPNLSTDIVFGKSVSFLGADLPTQPIAAGDNLLVATLWQVHGPAEPEPVFFTHLVGPAGTPVAQADRLDVPAYYWHSGDVFIQLHELMIPPDLPPGDYPLTIGIYNPADGMRWPVSVEGEPAGETLNLGTITIQE